jgi:hypothetical protein
MADQNTTPTPPGSASSAAVTTPVDAGSTKVSAPAAPDPQIAVLKQKVNELTTLLEVGDKESAALKSENAGLKLAAQNRSQLDSTNNQQLASVNAENGQLKGQIAELSDKVINLQKDVADRETEIKRLNTVLGASKLNGTKLPPNMYALCESVVTTVLVENAPKPGDLRKDDVVFVGTDAEYKRAQVQLPNVRVFRVDQNCVDELRSLGHLYA